ncbi:MAG: hypothetical protein KDB88_04370 [Flavobacteriales bacterium]|nr:hypothetical protein [Flavobacteriales bacterium]
MKRALGILVVLIVCAPLALMGQQLGAAPTATEGPGGSTFKDRVWFGGGLGLSFGTVTSISVEPLVGYKITENGKWSAGLGANYWYYRDNRYTPSFESSTYGGKLFSRYRIIDALFAHVEYNMMNFEFRRIADSGSQEVFRDWVPFLLVGGGYSARISGRSYLVASVLWDVLQDENSPYRSGEPWFSVGVGVGF